MPDTTMELVHRCGQIVRQGDERCGGCGQPLMPPIPEWLRDGAAAVETATGLDRLRVSLLGVVASAYVAGWDAAVAAFTGPERPAEEGPPASLLPAPPEAGSNDTGDIDAAQG